MFFRITLTSCICSPLKVIHIHLAGCFVVLRDRKEN